MGKRSALLVLAALLLGGSASANAERQGIRIDIPVAMKQADVVFNLDHAAFTGDMPAGLRYMSLLSKRLKDSGAKGRIVGVLHGQAAYMTLNDRAYNANRKVSTGNPYKEIIFSLLREGVAIEECAVSMENNGWTNDDLLPGVKVNSGAILRITQLVQQGYIQIQP